VSASEIERPDVRTPYDLLVGTMVGEYRVEGQLGEGGMGKVYAATHPVIAKRAAIKVLHPELSVNTEAVERFIQEARSVNQIGHPNIVDIFAFGALVDGRSYFIMEWLRGESLRDRILRGAVPIQHTLQILDTIATALEAAHDKGIVHRDLKPDNVFLVDIKGAAPQVKLLDFGIAKLLGNDDLRAERTRTGNLLGTPAYISPEQARGHAVDHRTDIYALGALAYELMTGWLPFPADNAADMIAKHLFEPPPHASLSNADVWPELDALICAMLAKDANERPTLAQVRMIVSQVPLRASAPTFPTTLPDQARGSNRSRAWLILIAALVAGLLGVVLVLGVGRDDGAHATVPPIEMKPVPQTVEPAVTVTKPEPAPAAPSVPPKPAEPSPPAVKAHPKRATKPTKPHTPNPAQDDPDAPMDL